MPIREKNMWANQMMEVVEAVRLLSRPNGASMEELTRELGVTKRTIYRLKNTLEAMLQAPLDEIDSPLQDEKRWKFPQGFTLTLPITETMGLTTPELMGLYLLRMHTGLFSGSIIDNDIDSAFEKIARTLSPAVRNMLERYSNLYVSVPKTPKDYSAHADIIEDLSFAIIERTTCTVTYTTFSDEEITEKRYNINPLHLFEHDGGLYVFALICRYNEIRLLAVERIKQVEPTNQHFDWPEDFDPTALLSSAFGLIWNDPITVRIQFTPSQARYIKERQWAKTQTITDEPDGSVILTMETSGRYEIKRWVMSFGPDAELLEPPDLRNSILNDIAAMAISYSNHLTGTPSTVRSPRD